MKKFEVSNESEFDTRVSVRVLKGNMTQARRDTIEGIVQMFNERLDNVAPYGVSPNGYAYRCGHEWDCCGCLIGRGMSVEFSEGEAVIKVYESFNL
jgi:hypothetical protein